MLYSYITNNMEENMKTTIIDNYIKISDVGSFSAKRTFDCGQCFRWYELEDGSFNGIAFGKPTHVFSKNNDIYIKCSQDEFNDIWRTYFDLDRDYDKIINDFISDEFTQSAAEFGKGIRILIQEPWEALCSFIISQCNNIPRIKKIISTLCSLYGEQLHFGNNVFYTFPSAEKIASLSLDDLSPLRCGYRAPYILHNARAVCENKINFDELHKLSTAEARKKMMEFNGIGAKVADCFLLFGLSKFDAFPIDTWIKKAKAFYNGNMSPEKYGKYAGIYQQYIFYYARSQKIK